MISMIGLFTLNAVLIALDLYEGVRFLDLGNAFVAGMLLSAIFVEALRK